MSGASNLFIGRGTGIQNMAGTQNAFLGALAGNQNTSGQNNSFVGYRSGFSNSTGNNNTFLGSGAGYTNGTGYNNAFAGYNAGYFNSQGNYNAFFGSGAGYANSQGSSNTFIGADAGSANTTGSGNTYMGSLSGASGNNTAQNTFVGANTGSSNTGIANTFLGFQAGQNNQSGAYNVFIGSSAGANNTAGLSNMFLGQQAGFNNTTGNYNLFMGNSSGSATTTGIGNTAIGDGSLLRNSTGIHNSAIGQYAGVESKGDENVFIGFAADVTPATPNLTNVVAIGARARVSQSNSIVLGAGANVGIGTSAPANKLEITQGNSGNSGLRFTNLTASSTASAVNQTKFLTVNAQGDVILGSLNGSARIGADDVSDNWQVIGENIQNSNTGGVVIGPGISKTPAGYRLYVADGVLTEKVKVAVRSTNDWSDRVFEKGYRLKSLSDVETFIRQSKHLPGVPSAEEVVKEGVDVGQMQAKLLEKVEELTLYVINLKKQNDALTRKSAQLEHRLNKLNTKRK
ncbi:hypothetical protein GCM10028825_44440 [Spirosoma agri]|uniref:TMF family protein n=2 Tax=Spirosoma agri TaxID=1987381 RepID=A0A6M0IM26_9BACT|nr:TMF family protein [Spirosoma agri]